MRRDSTVRLARARVFIAILATLAVALLSAARFGVGFPGTVETITVALPGLEQDALIYIAGEQRLFANNGLNVVIKTYDSGVATLNAMLNGEANIAEAAEFPVVGAAFRQERFRIFASNDRFENDYVIARQDQGIKAVSDLKGKRIGVGRGTITEFYLGRFLALNGMKLQDVTLVDVKPAQFSGALSGGDVDALIAWQPHINRMQMESGRTVVWPAQNNQAAYSVLASASGWLTPRPDVVRRFLRSLAEAEDYLVRNPDQARAIVQQRLNYDDAYIASVWPQHHFSLSLDLSLIVAMDDEAQWMIDNRLTGSGQRPNFLDYVSTDGLRAVKPGAVSLSR